MKTQTFRHRAASMDMLILGSSKVREMQAAIAGEYGYNAYNFWVKSSRAEDWYCITRFVIDHNKTNLRHILLGIDIESFTNAVNVDIRLLQTPQLACYLDDAQKNCGGFIESENEGENKRFRSILLQYQHGAVNRLDSWEGIDPEFGNATARDRRPLRFEPPLQQLAENMLRMKGFTRLHPMRMGYFLKLIQLCQRKAITITCFLTPLHQELDGYLSKHTDYRHRLDDLRKWIDTIEVSNFTFLDTPTVEQFGGIAGDFKDEAHAGFANSDILLRYVLTSHPSQTIRHSAKTAAAVSSTPAVE